jgi:hypothetical protein
MVVAPLTVLEAWKRELTIEGEPYLDLHGVKTKDRETALAQEVLGCSHRVWVLVNYQMVPKIPELTGIKISKHTDVNGIKRNRYTATEEMPWDLVALDESRIICNPQSQVTNLFTRGCRRTRHRAILSGLPAPENPIELFCQFQFLDGSFMGCSNYWQFKTQYFEPSPYNTYDWVPKKGARAEIKEKFHDRAYVLRRSQVNMGSKKIFQKRYVDMSPKQKSLYKSIVKDYAYQATDGAWQETQWAMTAAMWLQRLAGGFDPEGVECLSDAKAKEVLNLMKGELEGQQAVVWFKFRSELDMVNDTLTRGGVTTCKIDGDVASSDRGEALNKFREGRARVLLATEKCAKMGVDCSVADTAIYYSNEWSCDDRLQSEDRILHPHKNTPLLFIDLVTRDSVDTEVVERIRDKSFNAKELMRDYFTYFRSGGRHE